MEPSYSGSCVVAPIKFLTIPRLEFQGAVVGIRPATSISTELKLPLSKITYWTDSTTVLQWIQSKRYRFQTFVANRVSEVLEHSSCHQWRHVPGRLNPADDCSRGLPASSLTSDHPWFKGPPFLREKEDQWPDRIAVGEATNCPQFRWKQRTVGRGTIILLRLIPTVF